VRRVALAAGAALLALALPASAGAFYGNGAAIVSASFQKLEQGDDSSNFGAISGDGRYVAFSTVARNLFADDDPDPAEMYRAGGIFRRDLASGAVDLVADGDLHQKSDKALVQLGAHDPSISRDGRYVAFETAQKLVPADTNTNVDVYVRDMAQPLRSANAYTLVSAPDGGAGPATYAAPSSPNPAGDDGSRVWSGTSISADGSRVAFTTTQASNLPDLAPATPATPAGQIFVRDLGTRGTRLITKNASDGSPAGGASGAATISPDGSTVAWPGTNAPAQTPFMDGEIQDLSAVYYLWQRDGGATRRLTGIADLDDPACGGGSVGLDPTATGPCYGPLTDLEGSRGNVALHPPSLNDDGYEAAFVVSSGPRPNATTSNGLDLWVTDMRPGVSRKAGSRELTRDTIANDPQNNGNIDGVALSADGRFIALTTLRDRFLLRPPNPVGTFRRNPDAEDVYLIDLRANTIERVTRAYDGSDSNADALPQLTIDDDGGAIAFGSSAANLFFGDANGRPDVFASFRQAEPAATGGVPEQPFVEPPLPDVQAFADAPELDVTPRTLSGGRIELLVDVPEDGAVAAVAKTLPSTKRKKTKQQTIANTSKDDGKAPTVTLVLTPKPKFLRYIRKGTSLAAAAQVTFRPASAASQGQQRNIRLRFAWKKKRSKPKNKAKERAARR
jgi:hypothetical protein